MVVYILNRIHEYHLVVVINVLFTLDSSTENSFMEVVCSFFGTFQFKGQCVICTLELIPSFYEFFSRYIISFPSLPPPHLFLPQIRTGTETRELNSRETFWATKHYLHVFFTIHCFNRVFAHLNSALPWLFMVACITTLVILLHRMEFHQRYCSCIFMILTTNLNFSLGNRKFHTCTRQLCSIQLPCYRK